MKMKSGVGWVKVVLFATVLICPIAYAAPAGDESGIYNYGVLRDWINNKLGNSYGELDWIDKGLDFVYGNKKSGREATIAGTIGVTTRGNYSDKQRTFFVFGVIGGTILLIIILVSCCCVCYCLCRRSTNGRNSPAVSVLPGNGSYYAGYGHGGP